MQSFRRNTKPLAKRVRAAIEDSYLNFGSVPVTKTVSDQFAGFRDFDAVLEQLVAEGFLCEVHSVKAPCGHRTQFKTRPSIDDYRCPTCRDIADRYDLIVRSEFRLTKQEVVRLGKLRAARNLRRLYTSSSERASERASDLANQGNWIPTGRSPSPVQPAPEWV